MMMSLSPQSSFSFPLSSSLQLYGQQKVFFTFLLSSKCEQRCVDMTCIEDDIHIHIHTDILDRTYWWHELSLIILLSLMQDKISYINFYLFCDLIIKTQSHTKLDSPHQHNLKYIIHGLSEQKKVILVLSPLLLGL